MIFNNAIADLYNSKYHELQLKYDEIVLKINHAESDSFILADKALEKATTRGPRQSDLSYEKAVILANARYSRTNLKITEHFQKLRDIVLADQTKKNQRVDINYNQLLVKVDKELIKNEKQSELKALTKFTEETSSLREYA